MSLSLRLTESVTLAVTDSQSWLDSDSEDQPRSASTVTVQHCRVSADQAERQPEPVGQSLY